MGRSTKLLLDMLSKTCTDFQQLGVMVFTLRYTVELFIYCRLSTFGCYGLYLAIWYTVEDFVDLVWVVDVDNDRMGRSDGIHHHYWLHVLRNKLLQLIKKKDKIGCQSCYKYFFSVTCFKNKYVLNRFCDALYLHIYTCTKRKLNYTLIANFFTGIIPVCTWEILISDIIYSYGKLTMKAH